MRAIFRTELNRLRCGPARIAAVGLAAVAGLVLASAPPALAVPVCAAGHCVDVSAGPGAGGVTLDGASLASYSAVNNGQHGQNASVQVAGSVGVGEYEVPGVIGVIAAGGGHKVQAYTSSGGDAGIWIDGTFVSLAGIVCQLRC
jgi:hypothetical protein